MDNRDFKGVWIPKGIWLNDNLSALEKIVLTEIDSLDCDENGCYASNEYFSKFCQVTETTISTAIKKLIEEGYIEVIKFDGRHRYLKSNLDFKKFKGRLKKTSRQTLKNLKADFKNFNAININNNIDNNINNNINNKYIKFGDYKRIKLTQQQYDKLIKDYNKEFIDYQIKKLDEYVESNNNKNKYSNFNLVLRKAIRENWFKVNNIPNWFDKDNFKESTKEEIKELESLLEEYK